MGKLDCRVTQDGYDELSESNDCDLDGLGMGHVITSNHRKTSVNFVDFVNRFQTSRV